MNLFESLSLSYLAVLKELDLGNFQQIKKDW